VKVPGFPAPLRIYAVLSKKVHICLLIN
jgi:hypothetical protein